MSRAARLTATIGTLLALGGCVAALLIWWVGGDNNPLVRRNDCRVTVDGRTVALAPEQARHAATIAAVALERELPARAVTIALATAYQESDIYNIDYGDRDSLGLFQQRPSQGWGTPEQVQDPVYAAGAFYDALVDIPNYRDLEITVAAQEVQRSAFPDAYADHEDDARVLASALTGNSEAAFSCAFRAADYSAQAEGEDGLTDRARAVRDQLAGRFDDLDIGGFEPGGVDSGHIEGSAHYDGRALDVMFEPYDNADVNRRGWAVAHWAVANAQELGIATVIYDDRIWSARRSDEGWREYTHPSGATTDVTLRHLDHVHIDVAEGS
ncbi:hypothetical protein [Jiangella alkaliphila]|uniref:ARB-07466-like C-terminal domain-containing protein n=1 Tax=Jiangella alkaliphila TaxID=419479 RepID=A0A1H2JDP9_9ACTN|nr:hypothetical protein [Jiangella alkaliphila]SDU54228.1 hypothetical protein SAMN04488563_2554 [Jiangella alkaliphila]